VKVYVGDEESGVGAGKDDDFLGGGGRARGGVGVEGKEKGAEVFDEGEVIGV